MATFCVPIKHQSIIVSVYKGIGITPDPSGGGTYNLVYNSLTLPDHFLAQGVITCSRSAHTKKSLAQFTDLTQGPLCTYKKYL